MKRIGFDLDGCLVDFNTGFVELTIKLLGKNLYPSEWWEGKKLTPLPQVWDYPQFNGYSDQEVKEVWSVIKESEDFWLKLKPDPGMKLITEQLLFENEVYFITNRKGLKVKRQTEVWLRSNLVTNNGWIKTFPHSEATVLISADKGGLARSLNLDIYIDDNYDNIVDTIVVSPTTNAYLLDKPYNQKLDLKAVEHRRVKSVKEMFTKEGL